MGWKLVAWAVCLLPVVAGCGSVRDLVTGPGPTSSKSTPESDPRADATAAWVAVREQHPQPFSEDFRDGFLSGYADHLNRGAAAAPPTNSRFKKYLMIEGEGLTRDYKVGFQYGIDVATAIERRVGAVASAPPPKTPPPSASESRVSTGGPSAYKFRDSNAKGSNDPPPSPPNPSRPLPPLPKPELPSIPPFNPELPDGGKLLPLPVPSDADRLPAPFPTPPLAVPSATLTPLPVPVATPPLAIPSAKLTPLPVPTEALGGTLSTPPDSVPVVKVALPESPASTSLPAILQDIPPLPFRPGK